MAEKEDTNDLKSQFRKIFLEMNRNLVASGMPTPLNLAPVASSKLNIPPKINLGQSFATKEASSKTFFDSDIHKHVKLQDGKLVAESRINTQEVICMGEPFCWVTTRDSRYERCDFCLQSTLHVLIPCSGCRFAMYCGAQCQQLAWAKYHKLECAVLKEFGGDEPECCMLETLRCVCVGLALHRNNVASLWHQFQTPLNSRSAMRLDLTDYDMYGIFLGMSHIISLTEASVLHRRLRTMHDGLVKHLSTDSTGLLRFEKYFLKSLLVHHLLVLLEINKGFDILLKKDHPSYFLFQKHTVSNGWYPLYHLFEHSDEPNVVIINDACKRKIAIALRHIEPGDSITIGHMPLKLRVTFRFYKHGMFDPDCPCEECAGGFKIRRQ
uniref:MYND-type domain-containing protein n=1 Tax=Anopheles dirus TaxID=7168 RepID=A0A182MYN2_9DIPT